MTILRKNGVMDPAAESAEAALARMGHADVSVRPFVRVSFAAGTAAETIERLTDKVLANDAIDQVVVGGWDADSLRVRSGYEFRKVEVPLAGLSDDELQRKSADGQLHLNLAEMKAIQAHFAELGRPPTDVELETLAQTWSEHCSHKTLRGPYEYDGVRSDNGLLKDTIFKATRELDRDWCVSVFVDNAGVVRFDGDWNLCFKVETHNHPSAIEPYGGANTGIGGVIRDPLGTGLGAKPIANTDVFCFAPPTIAHDDLPPGTLHPRRVMHGVVAGVRDYGNRMGIPTVNGAVCFDDRYLGNPLVFCGTVGLLPHEHSFGDPQPGDLIVAVGGRTGRDGIHGATFSSAELHTESETVSGGAVQIGNAITEKKVADVVLAARDRGLYRAITDCGAGGFSSAVGEMGEKIGAAIDLDAAPLKYDGLSYDEIWISESQERMVLAVPPEKWDELHQLAASEDVEACVLGTFEPTGRLTLRYHSETVGDLSMQFLHDGRPPVLRVGVPTTQSLLPPGEGGRRPDEGSSRPFGTQNDPHPNPLPEGEGTGQDRTLHSLGDVASRSAGQSLLPLGEGGRRPGEGSSQPSGTQRNPHPNPLPQAGEGTAQDILLRILASPNVCSKEWIVRQYDHEVQAGSVVKPLVGVANDGPSDAAVIRPLLDREVGVAIGCGINPRYGDLHPYNMAASAIDEAIRNIVCVGGDPDRTALLDNFCWGNTERPEVFGSLVEAARACYDIAMSLGTPFISGKDSLYNEFAGPQGRIVIPPTLLISAMARVPDVSHCVTMDLKAPGNHLLLVGTTKGELGGSHFNLVTGTTGGVVPTVDGPLAKRTFAAIHDCITSGLVRSCHDCSEGGLAITLAEMAFAGGFGATVDLSAAPGATDLSPHALLFAESNSRFVLEVETGYLSAALEKLSDVPHSRFGVVNEEPTLKISNLIDTNIADLKSAWQRTDLFA